MTDQDPEKIFRELDHTADLSVEIFGGDLRDLFRNAVQTLYALLGLSTSSTSTASLPLETFTVRGQDREDALVRLLGELLSRAETEQEVIIQEELVLEEGCDKDGVHVFIEGRRQTFSEESRQGDYEVKAVTYHDTEIRRVPGGWIARLVLDV